MAQPPSPPCTSQTELMAQMAGYPPLTARDKWRAEFRDVGFLRHLWTNFGEVAPGVYRSNHPGARRLQGYAVMGIKAVLNLRGDLSAAPQRLEAATCAELGIEFHSVGLSARKAPRRQSLRALFEKFDTLPRPFLMHCKSGADRAGLASALYLMDQEGVDLETARKELSFRYMHIRRSETGILDHFLDQFAADTASSPMTIRDWVTAEYDPDILCQSYAALK